MRRVFIVTALAALFVGVEFPAVVEEESGPEIIVRAAPPVEPVQSEPTEEVKECGCGENCGCDPCECEDFRTGSCECEECTCKPCQCGVEEPKEGADPTFDSRKAESGNIYKEACRKVEEEGGEVVLVLHRSSDYHEVDAFSQLLISNRENPPYLVNVEGLKESIQQWFVAYFEEVKTPHLVLLYQGPDGKAKVRRPAGPVTDDIQEFYQWYNRGLDAARAHKARGMTCAERRAQWLAQQVEKSKQAKAAIGAVPCPT